jgi:glucosamine-6-phosphate deaminase
LYDFRQRLLQSFQTQRLIGGLLPVDAAPVKKLRIGTVKVEVHPSRESAGLAAAWAAADRLTKLAKNSDAVGVIFATGASQFSTLASLTSIADVPWGRVSGFHMDEYIGIRADHPASFRRYMRERLTQKVQMKEFLEIEGDGPDPGRTARAYAERLRAADPQLCLLGIGENGHLAFNDPDVADFADPLDAKIVQLDRMCRQQQVAEGWFGSVDEVPESAITLTIPTLMRVPKLIASVPGPRKATIVRRTLEEAISTSCPATILRTHPDVTIYLDRESASELDGVFILQRDLPQSE